MRCTSFATEDQQADLAGRYRAGGLGYGHAKQELFEVVEGRLAQPREAYQEWMAHPERIEEVLDAGATKARAAATVVLDRVRHAVGLT